MDKISRRTFTIYSFLIVGIAMVALGFQPPLWQIVIAFVGVAFVPSAAADLEDVYPTEMFPTEVRASGVGMAAGISRIGAAISTFLLPICLEKWGIGPTMFLLAGLVFFGFTIPWVPETRGVDLDETAEVPETPTVAKV